MRRFTARRSACADCGSARLLQITSPLRSPARSAAAARDSLRQLFPDQEVLGPAPAPVLKVNNRYRYHVLLVDHNCKPTRDKISWLLKTFSNDRANRGVNIFVDCNFTD